ncbi:Pr6Pr family membrane protein [Microbacterium sp. SS28]|uniref:Pr6Pr family membrane protein n=1 Tax=Microbacterium sp. SS28 TaxID=2919948 RepID=UPI001FA95829|nr:Pr6Pr family membrane protein [Microbacterium sp. SS28]
MTRTPAWASIWTAARAVAALLILAAIVAQAQTTIGGAIDGGRDVVTTTVNFFSFFTILSNVISVVVLAWAAVWFWSKGRSTESPEPRALATVLACATTYMIVTGIVYNLLLRGITLPQGTTVPWSNEVLHVVGPLFLLADLFLGPGRRALPWRAIAEVLVFPIAWVIYTLVRGPLTTSPVTGDGSWYPYPFLNPANFDDGYAGVAVYVVGIAVAIGLAATLVVWVGRRRGAELRAPIPVVSTSAETTD